MTKREAAIVAAYTGYLIGAFSDMHEYVEEVMGRPVWTHEMGSAAFMEQLRKKAKKDFVAIEISDYGKQ